MYMYNFFRLIFIHLFIYFLSISDATQIVCTTEPLGALNEGFKDQELNIEIILEDNTQLSPDIFVYMEDPVIESVEPLRSIVRCAYRPFFILRIDECVLIMF